jgi:hypothetical protein
MPTNWTGKQLSILIAAGMLLLFVGVVAGSFTGTLLRGNEAAPLLVGVENRVGHDVTTLSTNSTSGSALTVVQSGTGTAIRGESARGTGGIFVANDQDRAGLLAQNNAGSRGTGAALTADGNRNTGIHATSDNGVGIWSEGQQAALYADGAVVINGDLSVTGGCVGCALSILALNDSGSVLRAGNAVTITGATRDSQGTLLVAVAPARQGDRIVGIVDVPVNLATTKVGDESIARYVPSDGDVPPNGTLRLQTSGVVVAVRAEASAGQTIAGDSLTAGSVPGLVARLEVTAAGNSFGYALGPIQDGLVAVLLAPH